jgi:X-Pro dipeptidyl-peptidase
MRLATRLALGAVALATLGVAGTAEAADPVITIGPDGKSAPVFDYQEAIRERVYIPQPGIDQDRNGVDDKIAADIIRPKESGPDVSVPAIIDPSPYFTTLCRGNESQCMRDYDGDGVNDKWPLFYDNYFLPRGYAYVLAQMNGTGFSSGCPYHGGPTDIAGEKSVIDWLNGRVPGEDAQGNPMVADWHNGSSAMIGKSYDGTLANGVAATGVEGLKTIVPISAISAWYDYSRTGGIRHNTNYPASLSNTVTNPDRRALCAPSREEFNGLDGDETGDINPFWDDRDYVKDAGKVKASVFVVHGFQDDNVRMNHVNQWWDALKANGVDRKLWLMRTGHTDPFEARRAVWVDTLHRWFDHHLLDVDNGIDDEPAVTIETSKDSWRGHAEWPIPGTQDVNLYLQGTEQAAAGTLGGGPGGATDSLSFVDNQVNETGFMTNPTGSQANRRVFLSKPLKKGLRLSGTPVIDIEASLSTPQSNLGALLVDYGAGTQVTRSNEGIAQTTERTCWGESSDELDPDGNPVDSACYREVTKPTIDVTQWRVSRGVLDSSNRLSLRSVAPVEIDQKYRFRFKLMPTEHVFGAGHQIGIVLVGNLFGIAGTTGSTITVDTKTSMATLPLQGGYGAAMGAGAIAPVPPAN